MPACAVACRELPVAQDTAVHPAVCETLFCLARSYARHYGLNPDDAEDCGREFVLRALCEHASKVAENAPAVTAVHRRENRRVSRGDLTDAEGKAWQKRCAANFALDFRRALLRRLRHEISEGSLPAANDDYDGAQGTPPPPCPRCECADTRQPSVEACLLRGWLWKQVMDAVRELPLQPQTLFTRYLLEEHKVTGEDVAKTGASKEEPRIVFSCGSRSEPNAPTQSTAAIHQSLYRSRLRVRASLLRRGLTESHFLP